VKWAMAEMGLSPRGIRLPLTWLTAEAQPRVRAAMQQVGVI
jgi:4-hydroxy-tetrahydrodipicolinate synthase